MADHQQLNKPLQIERVLIASLSADPANVRKHDEKNLQAIMGSLRAFGQQKPIVVDMRGIVLAGNGTLAAAKALGWTHIDIVRTDLKGTEAIAYAIADNRTGELADWDNELLGVTLASIADDGFDLNSIGFDTDDLNDILPKPEVEGETDPDDVPEVPQNIHNVQRGDIWQLGNHRLMCGDSTDKSDVEKLMNGEKADMVFTDPPYDFETEGGGILGASQKMKDIKKLKIDKFDPDTLEHSLADTHVYFCNRLLIPQYIGLAKKWKVSWDLAVTHKTFAPANWGGHLQTDLEYIMILGKQAPNKGLEAKFYSKLFSGGRNSDDDMSAGWCKPVALCEKFIYLYSINLVYEPFLGSGSTLIACEKTGRKCFGCEIDPHYCSVIIERWQKFTGKTAVKLEPAHD